MYFVCFKDDEKYLRYLTKNCNTLIIDKSTIEEYLENYLDQNILQTIFKLF